MGQDHSLEKPQISNNKFLEKGVSSFLSDPRLIEQAIFVPELFAGQIDAEIKKLERLIEAMPVHVLEIEIVDGLNDRFSKSESIIQKVQFSLHKQHEKAHNSQHKTHGIAQNKMALLNEMKKDSGFFFELQTQQKYINLIKKLQHTFYIQKQLNNGMMMGKSDKKITVRKKIIPSYQSKLDKLLFSKLFLKYYLLILKTNLGSKSKQRKNLVLEFHNSIGKMICQMIQHNHLNQKKLTHLSYKIIYLEKVGNQQILEKTLKEIRQEFWPFYLTKEHSLTMKPQEFDRIRQICRCYLDELYLRSLKQAEDPDIITDINEGFGIIKNFPVNKVNVNRVGLNRKDQKSIK